MILNPNDAHMTRAVLERVAFGLRDSLEFMRVLDLIAQVRVSGGGAQSQLWRQILADVFNVEIVMTNVTQGAAYGAALLAGVRVGAFGPAADACARAAHIINAVKPGADAPVYAEAYAIYRQLYPALAPIFKQTAARVVKNE